MPHHPPLHVSSSVRKAHMLKYGATHSVEVYQPSATMQTVSMSRLAEPKKIPTRESLQQKSARPFRDLSPSAFAASAEPFLANEGAFSDIRGETSFSMDRSPSKSPDRDGKEKAVTSPTRSKARPGSGDPAKSTSPPPGSARPLSPSQLNDRGRSPTRSHAHQASDVATNNNDSPHRPKKNHYIRAAHLKPGQVDGTSMAEVFPLQLGSSDVDTSIFAGVTGFAPLESNAVMAQSKKSFREEEEDKKRTEKAKRRSEEHRKSLLDREAHLFAQKRQRHKSLVYSPAGGAGADKNSLLAHAKRQQVLADKAQMDFDALLEQDASQLRDVHDLSEIHPAGGAGRIGGDNTGGGGVGSGGAHKSSTGRALSFVENPEDHHDRGSSPPHGGPSSGRHTGESPSQTTIGGNSPFTSGGGAGGAQSWKDAPWASELATAAAEAPLEARYPIDWRRLPTPALRDAVSWCCGTVYMSRDDTAGDRAYHQGVGVVGKLFTQHGVKAVDSLTSRRDVRSMVRDKARFGIVIDIVATRRNILTGAPHSAAERLYNYIEEKYPVYALFSLVGITDNAMARVGRDIFLRDPIPGTKKLPFSAIDNDHLFLAHPASTGSTELRTRGETEARAKAIELRARRCTPKYQAPPPPQFVIAAPTQLELKKKELNEKRKKVFAQNTPGAMVHTDTSPQRPMIPEALMQRGGAAIDTTSLSTGGGGGKSQSPAHRLASRRSVEFVDDYSDVSFGVSEGQPSRLKKGGPSLQQQAGQHQSGQQQRLGQQQHNGRQRGQQLEKLTSTGNANALPVLGDQPEELGRKLDPANYRPRPVRPGSEIPPVSGAAVGARLAELDSYGLTPEQKMSMSTSNMDMSRSAQLGASVLATSAVGGDVTTGALSPNVSTFDVNQMSQLGGVRSDRSESPGASRPGTGQSRPSSGSIGRGGTPERRLRAGSAGSLASSGIGSRPSTGGHRRTMNPLTRAALAQSKSTVKAESVEELREARKARVESAKQRRQTAMRSGGAFESLAKLRTDHSHQKSGVSGPAALAVAAAGGQDPARVPPRHYLQRVVEAVAERQKLRSSAAAMASPVGSMSQQFPGVLESYPD